MTETPTKKKRGNPAWVKGHNKVQPVAQAEVADEAGKITAVDLMKAGPKPSEILEHLKQVQAKVALPPTPGVERLVPGSDGTILGLDAQGKPIVSIDQSNTVTTIDLGTVNFGDPQAEPAPSTEIMALAGVSITRTISSTPEQAELVRLREGIQWIYNRSRGFGGSYPITLKCQELLKG